MPTSIAFYRDRLGFVVLGTSHPGDRCNWAMLVGGGVESGSSMMLMLKTANESDERPSAPNPARAAAHGDAALHFICASADTAYRLLREAGLEPSEPTNVSYGMRETYVKDPDGYELCFQSLPEEPDEEGPAS